MFSILLALDAGAVKPAPSPMESARFAHIARIQLISDHKKTRNTPKISENLRPIIPRTGPGRSL
ncbi:MAG: hypothetical protein ACC661_04195, partial [Verrucomicrobiales bacterium]